MVDRVTQTGISDNWAFVKSLTEKRTLEDGKDSELEETDEAIESDEEWEDSDETSITPRSNSSDTPLSDMVFQRADSRTNLVSQCSLLTMQIRKNGGASTLQNVASRSTPAIRRPHTPNDPLSSSPRENALQGFAQLSNTHPPVLGPSSIRCQMISTELTESLRRSLLWEREAKNSTINAAKRRHTVHDKNNLPKYPNENRSSRGNYFNAGLQDYHQRGW